MTRKNYHLIRVHDGYVKDTDGHSLPHYKFLNFSLKNVKRYDNHSHLLVKLSPSSTWLLNYLVDHAGFYSNEVSSTEVERKLFIDFMKKNCGKKIQDDTVKKAFSKLANVGFLLNLGERAIYYVNPKYFYRADETNRRKILQELCSHAAKAKGIIGIQLRKSLGF